MLHLINFPVFLISMAIGLAFVYLSAPAHNAVYVYPTPDNTDKVQYKDKADVCFRFDPIITQCPDNVSLIKNIPVQN
jgi:hypothetical protein